MIALSTLSMVLCMTFPIKFALGFIFDLRYIPFIVSALYGGYGAVFPLYIVLNIYRFIIGGDGIFLSFLYSTIYFSLIPLWSKKFLSSSPKNRIAKAGLVSLSAMILYLGAFSLFYENLNLEYWTIFINVITIHVGGTVVIVLLIEKILYNEKLRERFLDTERLNLTNELSASISHELRNPLTVTSGFLQLLYKSTNINEKEKEYIDYSLQELRRAEQIISDFLSLAKPQAENMVYSNLQGEVEYVNNIMQPFANFHKVEIHCHFKNTTMIKYDQNQMQQCLINLYKNGIESMKDKGGLLSVNITGTKENVLITVTDTGIGMSKEEISQVGKPYYSTKKEGTGLGMMVVYNTILKLGGKINVESEKGRGTSFFLSIPTT